jgi:hypothetical protein
MYNIKFYCVHMLVYINDCSFVFLEPRETVYSV